MADNEQPDWTTTEDDLKTDPDMPEQPAERDGPDSVLPTSGDAPVGETKRIEEEKAAYDAAPADTDAPKDHAVGGSEGTADGQ
ncbi:hypothetical protein [Gordonia alkanivorans]|uniref:hypothetical protein n=1 Tax=Gordonia alkanivorans TaxID=84096 RepID=UPI00244A2CCF|nr:hypothetical protein [Gordonia alkanivorans]MDH3006206.1 hypothetical protein [Gordonia alkanivorans]MDH3015961.1 hypothetical protein [Gordonia alkanivorans]MDH3040535.1 hypothetical protein [Gordonia alkanivorans]MDH3047549.1 hypothetical protein [Gordonia alkanivorans]MDH3051201.1 hypothetical protein [Gordonia alkanivorans]